MKCTIKYCSSDATTTVTLDRPTSTAASADHAWTGHLETSYCGVHAIARPSMEGIEKYGDVWTMRPLATA